MEIKLTYYDATQEFCHHPDISEIASCSKRSCAVLDENKNVYFCQHLNHEKYNKDRRAHADLEFGHSVVKSQANQKKEYIVQILTKN